MLLDVNKLAAGKSYCSVTGLAVSRDNKILIYGVDYVSRRRYSLKFIDIQKGSLLSDKIENTTGQSVWASDNRTVFYVTRDNKTLRSSKIYKHRLDESITLTTSEWDEWGDPRKKEYYDYMLSYSPYDQVKAMNYPNIIVTTGFWDSQVQYWEPAKWMAKLRDMKTDKNKLVMDCNMTAGHGGASGRFERYRITALEYSFILNLAGITK